MTRDDIIRMAREAGASQLMRLDDEYVAYFELTGNAAIERFAALVAAAEREECAKVCDRRYMGDNNREDMEARRCAAAIRARGKK